MPDAHPERSFVVTPYSPEDETAWDEFVGRSANGTLLHTRRYLGYHGARFDDRSLLVRATNGDPIAVLPAAVDPDDATTVVSHPGITFGGLVTDRRLRGEDLITALRDVAMTYAVSGFARLVYRPVPAFFRPRYGDEDSYALFRLGASRNRSQLSAVVDLEHRSPPDAKKRNMVSKARRAGVTITTSTHALDAFWNLLQDQLEQRYGARPVHSLTEITDLVHRFPDAISLATAELGGEIVAGAVTYRFGSGVIHTQYLASSERGREVAALDLLCESLISEAHAAGARYFSFGTSTEQGGLVLNDSLYRFKHAFGAEGAVLDSYEVPLEPFGAPS
jgi:GNAT acetyltransferase-like protein